MPHPSTLTIAAMLLYLAAPHAALADGTTSSVFSVLAQLRQRRQEGRSGGLALLQRSDPTGGQNAARIFRSLDQNGDNLLGREEIGAFAASQGLDSASAQSELALLDTDGDGVMSMSEFQGVLDGSSADDTAAEPTQDAVQPQDSPAAQVAISAVQATPAAPAAAAPSAAPPVALPAAAVQTQTSSSSVASAGVSSSSDFVSARAKQLLASWNKFESDAKAAEAEAAALRAKAREELREAKELSDIADLAIARAAQASQRSLQSPLVAVDMAEAA